MSEQNRKFSSQETEDRRGRRTGFGDRSERNQSGNNADRRDDERTPKKRNERSYFDSKGKYQGRPIDDGEGEGRRNTYNDLPGRAPSGGGNPRRDDSRGSRNNRGQFESRGRGDNRGRNESGSRNARDEQSGSERRPQRGGYKGHPVERDASSRNDFSRPERSDSRRTGGGDRQRDNRREDSRGGRDNRGRFESRERVEKRGRSESWNHNDRGEQAGSERRPQRDGFKGRPVERDENRRTGFTRSDRSDSRRPDRDFRGGDRQRDNRHEDSRGGRDNRGRFESSDRRGSSRPLSDRHDRRDSAKRGFENRGRSDRPSRPQEGKRDGSEAFGKRPMRYDASSEGTPRNNWTESQVKKAETRPPRPAKKPFVPAKPSVPNLNEPLRINKALAFAGICSRRAADDLITQGVVFVNGVKVEEPGLKIIPTSDVLEVNAERVIFDTEKVEPLYVLLHKPVQTVCTANDPEGRPTVLDILPEEFKEKRIFPVGRLDFFSTGLLLLTNDGELTHRLTHPKWHQNKVYRVRVRGDVPEQVLEKFRSGMILEEGDKLAPVECKVLAHDEGNTRVEMVLTQGINRQIRRMFRDVGLTILNLHRVKIGPIQIGELEKGESRELTQEELAQLYEATGLSK
ncbi:pseudouridine synthase [Halodesulfovibrio aestuarii]|uniref:pseudouridine synthase n=1 Tax=Halodesulfovibrio aestuarii TaxID=126333 RepID=UPI003D351281